MRHRTMSMVAVSLIAIAINGLAAESGKVKAAVFEKKKAAVETVTPMMDRDGTWRVSGYFIK